MITTVRSGLDVAVLDGFSELSGMRVGIVANQASVGSQLMHIVDLVLQSGSCEVVRLFAPEHGFRGALQDMAAVDHVTDPITGLPVVSLYGSSEKSLYPHRETLEDLDALLFDLPDIGTRYYTFAQTLAYVLSACGPLGVKVIVLDRPNPLNGLAFEGSLLTPHCRSFCGLLPVPNRHGLTIGELAYMTQRGFGEDEWALPPVDCNLQVIKAQGWKREQYFDDTFLPWVYPSPNMPTIDTALVYPGTCLFEATNISEGRGTTRPFELIGAPFIDSINWITAISLEEVELCGAVLRPTAFIPQFNKWAGKSCHGVQIHVLDRSRFKPVRWGLAMLKALARLYPEDFAWRDQAYEFVDSIPAIDLLYGSAAFRKSTEIHSSLAPVIDDLNAFEIWYSDARKGYLLYD